MQRVWAAEPMAQEHDRLDCWLAAGQLAKADVHFAEDAGSAAHPPTPGERAAVGECPTISTSKFGLAGLARICDIAEGLAGAFTQCAEVVAFVEFVDVTDPGSLCEKAGSTETYKRD